MGPSSVDGSANSEIACAGGIWRVKEDAGGIGSGEEDRDGTGAGLATRGGVLLLYRWDVSEVSDKTANHARCWLVWGHREGRYGKVYLRSRLGRTYGGEVRAWWAVGVVTELDARDKITLCRSKPGTERWSARRSARIYPSSAFLPLH
jgi:hypothetical protein